MGGEDQLKALIRQTFSLLNTADKSVISVDQLLAQAVANVKRMIETLPNEGLLRQKAWSELEPLVRAELQIYTDRLGQAIVEGDSAAAPKMRDYAVREFEHGGADLPEAVRVRNQPVPNSVALALRSQVNGKTIKKLFELKDGTERTPFRRQESAVNKALFKTIDMRVRGGIIRGDTTRDIADLMATDVVAAGVPGVSLTAPVAKQIRNQAMAIARTATQDMQRQVKEQLYEENKSQLGGMVWMWSTALDSKTCETCAPLDQQRWEQGEQRPQWPLHPNCRCEALLIDPEDEFWNETERTAQQVKPATKRIKDKETGKWKTVKTKPYTGTGAYKTPVKVNGEKYWRRAVTVTSDRPPTRLADVYARWATDGTASLEAAMGPTRAAYFKRQFNEFNKDPEQILNSMLTGTRGAQKWIPVKELVSAK